MIVNSIENNHQIISDLSLIRVIFKIKIMHLIIQIKFFLVRVKYLIRIFLFKTNAIKDEMIK